MMTQAPPPPPATTNPDKHTPWLLQALVGLLFAVLVGFGVVPALIKWYQGLPQDPVLSAECVEDSFLVPGVGPPPGTNLSLHVGGYPGDNYETAFSTAYQHLCDGRRIPVNAAEAQMSYDPKTGHLRVWWNADLPVRWQGIFIGYRGGAIPMTRLQPDQTSYERTFANPGEVEYIDISVAGIAPSLPPPLPTGGGGLEVTIEPLPVPGIPA